MQLDNLIEKPERDQAPSNLAIAGRYILTPGIFRALEKTPRGKGNEIQLTDALRILLKQEGIIATTIEGKRYDIGNKMDYLKTTVEFALKRKEFSAGFETFLRETIQNLDEKRK
jgi:UTP--glucose-1-phosphate uridylyltransferase